MSKLKKLLFLSLLIIIATGVSYSYFVATILGGTTVANATGTSTFDVYFNVINGEYINLTNGLPIFASEVNEKADKTVFTVTAGNNKFPVIYTLSLTSLSISSNLQVNDFKWSLTCTNDSSKSISGTFNNVSASSYTLATNLTLYGNETDTYEFRIWIEDDGSQQSELMNGIFSGKLTMNANMVYSTRLLTNAILGDNNKKVTSTVTTPGLSVSSSSEAVLASASDDYGTSYYYRGNVANNYVVFANMCWRIVRVTGNSATKLVLYNFNPNNVVNPCDTSQDGATYSFARYTGSTYTSYFNSSFNDNAYIGFMYGSLNALSYSLTHKNTNKSTILTNLETWYINNIANYSSYLADVIWCNDKSVSTGLGLGDVITYYGANLRTIYATLVCPNDLLGGKLSKFTVDDTTYGNGALDYPIGLLTGDEIVYAGGLTSVSNTTYYLYKNASGNAWYTMTPLYYNIVLLVSMTGIIDVTTTGSISSVYNSSVALRPAIALKSSTKVIGIGTTTNPYIVK